MPERRFEALRHSVSACRGEGRKASEPNREMSNRDAPAAIISKAQQASPKVIGQREFARPSARILSRTANRTMADGWEACSSK